MSPPKTVQIWRPKFEARKRLQRRTQATPVTGNCYVYLHSSTPCNTSSLCCHPPAVRAARFYSHAALVLLLLLLLLLLLFLFLFLFFFLLFLLLLVVTFRLRGLHKYQRIWVAVLLTPAPARLPTCWHMISTHIPAHTRQACQVHTECCLKADERIQLEPNMHTTRTHNAAFISHASCMHFGYFARCIPTQNCMPQVLMTCDAYNRYREWPTSPSKHLQHHHQHPQHPQPAFPANTTQHHQHIRHYQRVVCNRRSRLESC